MRRSFKTDESFLEKLAIGAIGARAVFNERQRQAYELAFEKDRTYVAASAFRFVNELPAEQLVTLWNRLHSDDLSVEVNRHQTELVLMEKHTSSGAKPKRK